MRKFIFFLAVVLLSAFNLQAAIPFGDGFAGGKTGAYLENADNLIEDATLTRIPGMTGKNCLRLTYDNDIEARFIKVPVSDSNAYVLSFRGRWENTDTIENNPTYESALFETWRNALVLVPTLEIAFYDIEEKPMKDGIFMAMPYGNWRKYRNVFYPPPGAFCMQLRIKSKRTLGAFYVDNIKFETLKNPDNGLVLNFDNGKDDYSGSIFGFKVDGSLRILPDRRSMIASGYGKFSDVFKLNGPGKYSLTFKGEVLRDKGGASSFAVQFLDSAGKIISQAASNKLDREPLDFTMPDGVAKVRLQIYNHMLEEIRISHITP